MRKIKKKLWKPVALLLTTTMVMSTLVGCGSEAEVKEVVPETQLFEDTYERNAEITDMMTYTMDYMSDLDDDQDSSTIDMDDLEIATLFDYMKVQVDGWDCVEVGLSTMGEIVSVIDAANEEHVTSNTQAIIDERQTEIDQEYEAAKAKAEAKGKKYTKAKKEVRTDDIDIEAPYAYMVTFEDDETTDYQPTLLVDPSKYDEIYLDVSKYGIPYVRFEFIETSNICNTKITQESDWVMNGVTAADVSSYQTVNDDGDVVDTQDFVDADGLNKAAKKNMYMSGNIAFGGEGFTWDSLMLLCSALQLVEDESPHGYEQSSDKNFTYYTIELLTNAFQRSGTIVGSDKIYCPVTRLVATFDPLTQVCLNWTIDTYHDSEHYSDQRHDLKEANHVNVHQYQVDTNDYDGMRESIKTWIKNNALETTTEYCALDESEKNPLMGIVETGSKNLTIEPVIDGVTYNCLESTKNADGSITGTFITKEDLAASESAGTEAQVDQYIMEHSHTWTVRCCLLDENNNIIGSVENINQTINYDSTVYYVADYENTDIGYKDIRLLTEPQLQSLLVLYIKTYQLNKSQAQEMTNLYKSENIFSAKEYVDNLFAEAEAAQKGETVSGNEKTEDENDKDENSVITITETFYDLKSNSKEYLGELKYNEQEFDINSITLKDIEELGFKETESSYVSNELLTITGTSYVNEADDIIIVEVNESDSVTSIIIESESIECFGGLKLGMTVEEALTTVGLKDTDESGRIVLKGEDSSVVVLFDMINNVVEQIEVLGEERTLESPNKENEEEKEENGEESKKNETPVADSSGSSGAGVIVIMMFVTLIAAGVVIFVLHKSQGKSKKKKSDIL